MLVNTVRAEEMATRGLLGSGDLQEVLVAEGAEGEMVEDTYQPLISLRHLCSGDGFVRGSHRQRRLFD